MASDRIAFDQTAPGEYRLDITGYGCPHVQIYTGKALDKLQSGDRLTLVFDNPSSGDTVFFMLDAQGDEILSRQEEGGTFTWTIRKH